MSLPITYSTVNDMLAALPTVGSLTNITSSQLARNIGIAEAVINAKLAGQYSVPISPAPPLLQVISTDLALYYSLSRRINAGTHGSAEAVKWPDRYKESMDLLNEIASGELPLLTSSGAVISERTGQVWSNNLDAVPTFYSDGAAVFEVYVRDEVKLDDRTGSV